MKVREVHGQYSIKNLQGRSVRLDILAVDEQNRAYNIEVQRSDRGASENAPATTAACWMQTSLIRAAAMMP